MARCAVIVLAAGASRRMRGADKLLEDVDGTPLLRHVVTQAIAAGIGPVYVTLPPAPHARYAALEGLNATPLPVADAADGMGASLSCAFGNLPAKTDKALILLADHPDLTAEDFRHVAGAPGRAPANLIWRATSETGKPGHPICVDKALFSAFARLKGDTGGRRIIQAAKPNVHPVPLPGQRATTDLDTPEAWAAWRKETGRQ
ncbi:MAG: nucleotidyltransferase family protein [Rhodobacteraceae bacterium]|nr:nucleotidyltransferase family protein [Paracoccaceae bacterium]